MDAASGPEVEGCACGLLLPPEQAGGIPGLGEDEREVFSAPGGFLVTVLGT